MINELKNQRYVTGQTILSAPRLFQYRIISTRVCKKIFLI